MKRFYTIAAVLVGLSFAIFCLATFIMAQDAAGPDSVTLPGGAFGKVTFSHKGHAAAAGCKDCHHMGEVTQKCASCHSAEAKLNAKDAFHKNCIDCHKAKEQGPTGCMDCHKKG